MYDIVTVLPVVTALRSCNVNPHVCAETQLTHLFICEILRTHLFVVKSYETSLILILRRQRVDSQHVVTHHASNASLCKDIFSEGHVISHPWHLPMTPTQQSPTESIDQHTVDMSDRHSNETHTQTNSQGKSFPYGLTPNGFVLPVTSAHRPDFISFAVHNDARS